MEAEALQEIFIERIIDGPREAVFQAWTQPDQLKQWWGPTGCTTPYAEVDLRPGGRYLFVMQSPEGEPFHLAGIYHEIVPPERLVYSWKWELGGPDGTESIVTVEFEDLGEQTRISVTHGGFPIGSATADYQVGWTGAFDHLEQYLAYQGVAS